MDINKAGGIRITASLPPGLNRRKHCFGASPDTPQTMQNSAQGQVARPR